MGYSNPGTSPSGSALPLLLSSSFPFFSLSLIFSLSLSAVFVSSFTLYRFFLSIVFFRCFPLAVPSPLSVFVDRFSYYFCLLFHSYHAKHTSNDIHTLSSISLSVCSPRKDKKNTPALTRRVTTFNVSNFFVALFFVSSTFSTHQRTFCASTNSWFCSNLFSPFSILFCLFLSFIIS